MSETLQEKSARVADEIYKIIRDNDMIAFISVGAHKEAFIPDVGIGHDIRMSYRFCPVASYSNIKETDNKDIDIVDLKNSGHIATVEFFDRSINFLNLLQHQFIDVITSKIK